MVRDERADFVQVIAPDRISELHGVDEPRPTRRVITPGEHELRVGQRRGSRVDRFLMVLAQFNDGIRIAGVYRAEELFGLTMKLLEVGPDGQAARWQGIHGAYHSTSLGRHRCRRAFPYDRGPFAHPPGL